MRLLPTPTLLCPTLLSILLLATAPRARAQDLVVYGAGSLREAIGQIAAEFGQAHGIAVRTQFGPSGRMRERIENGDHVDLFTSADVGHARKLVRDGRASLMAVFVRNAVCLLAPATLGATPDTVLDRILAPGIRLGMSPPGIDPLGDYTVRLLDLIDAAHPGAAAALRSRAVIMDTPPGAPPPRSGDNDADAILDGRIDASIVYCSGRDRYARLLPGAALLQFPPAFQVGPEYALAVLNGAHPAAPLLALSILSPEGQATLAQRGFRPVTLPAD